MNTREEAIQIAKLFKNQGWDYKIDNKYHNIYRIRVRVSQPEFLKLINELNVECEHVSHQQWPVTGSIGLKNHIFLIKVDHIPAIVITDSNSAVRKSLAPSRLGLAGHSFISPWVMKQAIFDGLNLSNQSQEVINFCKHIINSIDGTDTFTADPKVKFEKNIITSDFGEIAAPYRRLVLFNQKVEFPSGSNHMNIDYICDGIPVSAKGNNGSSRFTFCGNKSIKTTVDNLGSSNIELMFKSLYYRKIYDTLTHSAPDCPPINWWLDKVGTFSKDSFSKYIQNVSWDQFENDLQHCQTGSFFSKLGIPDKNKVMTQFNNGSENPLLFALLTIWARNYHLYLPNIFSKLAKKLTSLNSNIEFEYFDYDDKNNVLLFNKIKIKQYDNWCLRYWSNGNKPLNNYPSLQGIN